MLRYLFFVDVAFAVLFSSMVIGVGVSALLLGWHLDVAPQYREMTYTLIKLTLVYLFLTLASGMGALGIFRKKNWHWAGQTLFAISAVIAYQYSVFVLTNQ